MTAGAMPRSSLAFKLLVVFISAIVVIAIFYALNVWLNWTVFQYMYSIRQGLTGPALYFITAIRLWWLRFLPCWSLTQSLGIAIYLVLSLQSVQGPGQFQGNQGSGLTVITGFTHRASQSLRLLRANSKCHLGYGSMAGNKICVCLSSLRRPCRSAYLWQHNHACSHDDRGLWLLEPGA